MQIIVHKLEHLLNLLKKLKDLLLPPETMRSQELTRLLLRMKQHYKRVKLLIFREGCYTNLAGYIRP